MSNVGKIKILLPSNLNVKVFGWKLFVNGPFGQKIFRMPVYTHVKKTHALLAFTSFSLKSQNYGSIQRKLQAHLYGFSLLYIKRLIFVGVGYRARMEKRYIVLSLGFSHEISLRIPKTLTLSIVKRSNVVLKSSNFEEISQFAYRLRSFRRPEPFKGKGIHCKGEVVRRKEGKKKKI